MAAPTDVRVEATSITTTHLRWTYGGASLVKVYRSSNGTDYTVIAILGSSVIEFEDSNLSSETKYWYKLSDDDGATFSDVVTVWTHACAEGSRVGFSLPYFDVVAEEETTNRLNEMARQVEDVLRDRVIQPGECIVCVEDGRLVLTCEEGCRKFVVIVTEDVNSISAPGCEDEDGGPDADFIVPPGETRQICGFPNGWGFGGDECFYDPVAGGSSGRTLSTGKKKTSKPGYGGGGGGGGGLGGGCTCLPGKNNELTIKVCGDNLCQGTNKRLQVKVCGGQGPYVWTKTGGIKFEKGPGGDKVDTVENDIRDATPSAVIVPPENTGWAVGGNAYDKIIGGVGCGHTLGDTHAIGHTGARFDCNDDFVGCTSTPDINDANLVFGDPTCSCAAHEGHPINGSLFFPTVACGVSCDTSGDGGCACAQAHGAPVDRRTAQMIANGCSPCGVAAAGATVTVTDAAGAEATVEIQA